MNRIGINLHDYYSKLVNLFNYTLANIFFLGKIL